MKTGITISFCLAVVFAYAQDSASIKGDYKELLVQHIVTLNEATDQESYERILYKFERLGDIAKDEWLPLYYIAYCKIVATRWEKGNSAVQLLDNALDDITNAQKLSLSNSELLTLEGRAYAELVKVDPIKYGPQYTNVIRTKLSEAIELDKTNPRAYMTLGVFYYYFPGYIGGDKRIGCRMFVKASELFAISKSKEESVDSILLPHWGAELNAWYCETNKCNNSKEASN